MQLLNTPPSAPTHHDLYLYRTPQSSGGRLTEPPFYLTTHCQQLPRDYQSPASPPFLFCMPIPTQVLSPDQNPSPSPSRGSGIHSHARTSNPSNPSSSPLRTVASLLPPKHPSYLRPSHDPPSSSLASHDHPEHESHSHAQTTKILCEDPKYAFPSSAAQSTSG